MLYRLVAEADVFITNFPPAVRGRLGMTYAKLAPLNERLIYASFTGYGEKGEEANKPGFDSNAYWARSGLMDLVRADIEHRAGALGRRHGRPSLRHGAVRRHRHRALQARAHRQGFACEFEPDGQRHLGQRHPRPGQIMRREIQRAASPRARAERGDQPLQVPRRTLDHPVAAQRGPAMADARALHRAGGFHHRCQVCHQARPPCALAGTDQDLRRDFCRKDLAEWRRILDGNGLVFGVVGILDDIPNDRQMLENEVLVPFEGDTMLTVNSPIWVDGSKKSHRGIRPASASTATRSCARPAMTRPRSGSCGPQARWRDRTEP